MCTAATMGALGRVPIETRLAPKSESWQLSPHRRGVGEALRVNWPSVLQLSWAAPTCSDDATWIRARGRSVLVHESSWRPLGMPTAAGRAAKHSMRDDRRSEDFTLGTVSRRNDIALHKPDRMIISGLELQLLMNRPWDDAPC